MIAAVLWTGGKDSVMAFIEAVDAGHDVRYLVTFAPENPSFKAHALPLMKEQAAAIGKPHIIKTVYAPYSDSYETHLRALHDELGVDCIVTGDIDYIGSSTTNFIQERCRAVGLTPFFPLWQRPRESILNAMLQRQLSIVFSCVKTTSFEPVSEWLGQTINQSTIERLKTLVENDKPIDICGENGEYHTMVLNAPIFQYPLTLPSFTIGTVDKLSYIKFDSDN